VVFDGFKLIYRCGGSVGIGKKSAPNFPFNHQEKYPSEPENGEESVREK